MTNTPQEEPLRTHSAIQVRAIRSAVTGADITFAYWQVSPSEEIEVGVAVQERTEWHYGGVVIDEGYDTRAMIRVKRWQATNPISGQPFLTAYVDEHGQSVKDCEWSAFPDIEEIARTLWLEHIRKAAQ